MLSFLHCFRTYKFELHLKQLLKQFNLGPQHLLEDLVDEVYAQRPREFLYKQDDSGNFSSYTIHIKENKNIGSAIITFRKRQEEKSKFPLDFWGK